MEKERKYAVFAKTRRRGTSRYRNSPICRQRKIPEDSAKGERERERGREGEGVAWLPGWQRSEKPGDGKLETRRNTELGSLFVEDSFREDAIYFSNGLASRYNAVLITRARV